MRDLNELGVVKTVKFGEYPELEAQWFKVAETKLEYAHPNRKKEWVLARIALKLAFAEYKLEFTSKHEFIGYQHIKGLPGFSFSLSHSLNYGGVWLVPGLEDERLGFDIETKTRVMKDSVQERFTHLGDVHTLSGLVLWTVKEAAYKSVPEDVQKKIWLNSIQVEGTNFKVEKLQGEWSTQNHGDLILSRALLRL